MSFSNPSPGLEWASHVVSPEVSSLKTAKAARTRPVRSPGTLLISALVVSGLGVAFVVLSSFGIFGLPNIFSRSNQSDNRDEENEEALLDRIPFDGRQAFTNLAAICEFGPRPSGSAGMAAQQKMLSEHFTRLGGRVTMQSFDVRHPEDGSRVTMSNMIVQWHPERKDRILLCAHYDTRPFPDEDPENPRGVFIGANDGASGVAVLCELGRHMPKLESRYGVDFVLFDGEEFLFDKRRDADLYFLGSTHFARDYAGRPPGHRYHYGVLLDMVGDKDLHLYQERNSWRLARGLVRDIWGTAARLGVKEFRPRLRHAIRDDHLPLNQIAGIPSCDIIDLDYPYPGARQQYWHTEADTPDKCSALSLARVGWVLHEWLKQVQ